MPCNCDHLKATSLELEISRVACLMDEIHGKKKINESHWDGYHPNVYGKVNRDLANKYTEKLCSILKEEDVSKYSLEMQIWWRDHQKADEKRLRKEEVDAEKEIERLKRNLKELQEKIDQLQTQPPILIKK